MKKFIAKHRFQVTIGCMFVLAGLLMGYQPYMRWYSSRHVSRSAFSDLVLAPEPAPAPALVTRVEGKPTHLSIPSIHVELDVIDGLYNTKAKTWTLTKDKAQYATITPPANNIAGNTFIYGHNRRGVFASLKDVKSGDTAIVTADNGKKYIYTFRLSLETNPYDDTLFYYQGPPIMTIQTCSGLWYQNRQLFTFDLTEVVDNA